MLLVRSGGLDLVDDDWCERPPLLAGSVVQVIWRWLHLNSFGRKRDIVRDLVPFSAISVLTRAVPRLWNAAELYAHPSTDQTQKLQWATNVYHFNHQLLLDQVDVSPQC